MQNEKILVCSENVSNVLNEKRLCYRFMKRTFDVLVSMVGIFCLLPLMIFIKIAYLFSKDKETIFHKQERIGVHGKIFILYKFRTMQLNADEILERILNENPEMKKEYSINKKLKDDPRITKVGKVLRRLSLDEFPQFINIFKGDMSFVGNRPYLPREKEDMGIFYQDIIKTKPGLTGLWQTSGRSNTTFQERLLLEQEYSKINGLILDIKIIFKTVLQLFRKGNAI